jgi:hypothetical protein
MGEDRRAADGSRRWGRRTDGRRAEVCSGGEERRARVGGASTRGDEERERCGLEPAAVAAVCVCVCGGHAVDRAEEEGISRCVGDLGFGPFTGLWAFLLSEVHLSPVFFFFLKHMCVYTNA